MALNDDVSSDIDSIISQKWDARDGTVVPQTTDVTLAGGGVNLDVAILYSDLADSTELVMTQDRRVAAKVMKCFLAMSSRIMRNFQGEIRSFDGDRVMGIFIGGYKNTNATKAALKINHSFTNILKPKLLAQYPKLEEGGFKLNYGSGIDTGTVLAVRGGVRGSNDLVWVGRGPNIAAKLSNLRDGLFKTYITGDVHKQLNDECKLLNGVAMWQQMTWKTYPDIPLYRSNYWWLK